MIDVLLIRGLTIPKIKKIYSLFNYIVVFSADNKTAQMSIFQLIDSSYAYNCHL